ncbi:hypothetical protein CLV35_2099 [Motilibacter peucedani]|uniref:Uncharacterized protein n=1 Tax=Motilibacter peucedani TaxID=598650 RepID=A0A420XQZ3_9ACTN|nr:zinc ribbon domain-containing protein [Motilibacter peucedani]RKS75622.1 hypothetical protein CLV35_2099 [Motilibacter peucedani]
MPDQPASATASPVLDERALATALRDTAHCPDCGQPLDGPRCPRCGADLEGQAARQLLSVSLQAAHLLESRAVLRAALHGAAVAAAPPAARRPPAARQPEAPAVTAQQVLLAVGATLLAVAALVFTVVAWDGLGIGGRAGVLVAVTALAAGGSAAAVRRALPATGESLAALTAVLCLLDAYAARATGLAGLDGVAATAYWAAVLGVGGLLALLLAERGRLLAPQLAGAAAAVVAVPLLAAQVEGVAATAALVAGAATLGALASWRTAQPVRLVLALGAVAWWLAGAVGAAVTVGDDATAPATAAALVMVAAGALAVVAGLLTEGYAAVASCAAAAACLPVLAVALAARGLDARDLPLVALAAVAVLCALAQLRLLPTAVRSGAWTTVVLVTAVASAVPAALALTAAAVPGLDLGSDAGPADDASRAWVRAAGSADVPTAAAPLALLAAAAVLVVVARAAAARPAWHRAALAAVTASVAGALVLVPVAAGLRTDVAALSLVLVGTGTLAVAGRGRRLEPALAGASVAAAGLAWAGADDGLLLACLVLVGVVSMACAVTWPGQWRPVPSAAAALAAASAAGCAGATAGLGTAWAADAALAAAVLAALAAGSWSRSEHGVRTSAQASAAAAAAVALALTAAYEPALSLGLTLAGAGAGVLSFERDHAQSRLRLVAGLLLASASWSRLHGAGVEVVEAYTLPSAAALLVAGWRTARRRPLSSWAAYGSGLSLALLPTLLVALAGTAEGATRPLVLAAGAALVTVVGARTRLAAPLLIGAGVLAVDALAQVGPAVAALPRWVVVGALGALLVALGTTYERRLRQVRALTTRLHSLR